MDDWVWEIGEFQRNLKKRGMESIYCHNRHDALQRILWILPPGSSVCWGGSVTLHEIGLIEALRAGPYKVFDRLEAKNTEESRILYSQCMLADYYFCSVNALTRDGELINMDGNGNRVSCLMYGPEKVFVVVGKNKFVPDVAAGLARIKKLAAPLNAKRGCYRTGCLNEGQCVDCFLPECICGHFTVTRFNRLAGRITILLVDEELGF